MYKVWASAEASADGWGSDLSAVVAAGFQCPIVNPDAPHTPRTGLRPTDMPGLKTFSTHEGSGPSGGHRRPGADRSGFKPTATIEQDRAAPAGRVAREVINAPVDPFPITTLAAATPCRIAGRRERSESGPVLPM